VILYAYNYKIKMCAKVSQVHTLKAISHTPEKRHQGVPEAIPNHTYMKRRAVFQGTWPCG